ncbi:MAG TPA: ferrochelatase [Acidimicrobiales bacterium]|nr:ferrochelatase [Acidimicrobiales bacterium]
MTVGVLVMAYGSPAGPEDVEAYYTHIRRGRPPTDEQLADLRRRYEAVGGISTLRARTDAQAAALQRALGDGYRVVLGMKHATPFIEDAVATLGDCDRAVGLVLAPHHSALSVGEYLDRAASAAPVPFTGIESWATLPAYVAFLAGAVGDALAPMPPGTKVLFTAHSLPARILETGDRYPDEVRATADAVAAAAGLDRWAGYATAWQSAGRTPEPWLGPDVLEVIDAADTGLVVCPCGFVSDHLEVAYDLDIEAAAAAAGKGIPFARTRVLNDDAATFAALAERVREAACG